MTILNTQSGLVQTPLSGAFEQGVKGLHSSLQAINQSAHAVSLAGVAEPKEPHHCSAVDALIDAQQQHLLFDASARVVDMGEKALGALIDIQT